MEASIRRAGDVVGTPDWQLDRMYEDESAKKWEEQTKRAADPMDFIEPEDLLYASTHLEVAKEVNFDNALEWISKTIDLLKGTPEADKLAEIYDRLSDLSSEMMQIHDKAYLIWREKA